ncbi:T9SS type A sorting domain-containing protein [bacterium]|nr:T9SS type A sorting domain-containing protein [bacterium]
MLHRKIYLLIVICLFLLSHILSSQITFQGYVRDNGGEYLGNGAGPVENALVTLINQSDTTQSYSNLTDEQGYFEIQVSISGINESSLNPSHFQLRQNYPNPFNPSTIIGYELSRPCHVRIDIYNIRGQKVKTLSDGFQYRSGSVIWEGTNDLGEPVAAGLYIYTMQAMGEQNTRKMLLIDGGCNWINMMTGRVDHQHSEMETINKNSLSNSFKLIITGKNILSCEELMVIDGNTTRDVTVKRTVRDIDGNVYRTVKIGDQWWMAENLKATHYQSGDPIPYEANSIEWTILSTGAYCAYYNDANNESDVYGYLYNWYALNGGIAPEGWHVPTD